MMTAASPGTARSPCSENRAMGYFEIHTSFWGNLIVHNLPNSKRNDHPSLTQMGLEAILVMFDHRPAVVGRASIPDLTFLNVQRTIGGLL
jgi:hypothetical protein